MKQRIRLTESDLHRIVKESVNRILNEESPYDNDGSFYDEIDRRLSQNTDDNAYVSRFYSDENQITIAVYVTNDIRNTKRAVIETMKMFDYEYYTAGANGKYVMMTFKKNRNEVTESIGKKVTNGKSYWGDTVNKILSEVSSKPNGFNYKPIPAYWEKGEPRRERSDYDDYDDDLKEHSMNYGMTQESIDEGLGDFFDKFRRTSRARNGSPNQNFDYNSKTNKFSYYDERGNEHDTGIGYENGKIGRNWNPFKSNGRKTNVTPHDAKMMRLRLQQWQNDNAPGITNGYRRDDEYKRWRDAYYASEDERRRREQEKLQRLSQPKGYNQFDHFSHYLGSNPLST